MAGLKGKFANLAYRLQVRTCKGVSCETGLHDQVQGSVLEFCISELLVRRAKSEDLGGLWQSNILKCVERQRCSRSLQIEGG